LNLQNIKKKEDFKISYKNKEKKFYQLELVNIDIKKRQAFGMPVF